MLNVDDVKQLLARGEDQVLSLYLRVDPTLPDNQSPVPGWRSGSGIALHRLAESLPEADRGAFNAIQRRALDFLTHYQPHGKGLALFYSARSEDVFELPVAFEENTAAFGQPVIAPLLWVMDEYERYLVVLVADDEAHFLTTYLGDIGRQEAMASDRFSFDAPRQRLLIVGDLENNAVDRFQRNVASRVAALMRDLKADRVILGGDLDAARSVLEYLSPNALANLVGVLPIQLDHSDDEIMGLVLPAALEYERAKELEIVEDVITRARTGAGGVTGHDAVLAALDTQRVDVLIAPWPLERGELMRTLPVQALQAGSRLELVRGAAADRVRTVGGLAARLRV